MSFLREGHVNAYLAALKWYQDQGIDEALDEMPVDRRALKPAVVPTVIEGTPQPAMTVQAAQVSQGSAPAFLGKSDASAEAIKCAQKAATLAELQEAIQQFDGIALKKTASNMVFASGQSDADVMLIGEAPAKEDDRAGEAFVDADGRFLDLMISHIGLSRAENIYMSNLLNWRPPGGRSPNPAEIEVSLPFIEKHIALVKPKLLILCGATVAQTLLGTSETLSKLRKTWHDYTPQTPDLAADMAAIPAIVTYAPAYLLTTPTQKRAAWADLLEIKAKMAAL